MLLVKETYGPHLKWWCYAYLHSLTAWLSSPPQVQWDPDRPSWRLVGVWGALKIFQNATNQCCQCEWRDMTSHASQPAAGYVGDMLVLTGIWGGKEPQLLFCWYAGLKDVGGTDHEQYSAARPLFHINTPDVSVTRGCWLEEERDTDWELQKERWGGRCSDGNKEMASESRITLNLPPRVALLKILAYVGHAGVQYLDICPFWKLKADAD